MIDISVFEELGLTDSEAKTYLALLELGSSTAGDILVKSGLQNSVIHRALNSLIEKSIINYIMEGKRKVYQATDPTNFYHFIDEKKRKFDDILPKLKEKQSLSRNSETATVYKGNRGINEVYSLLRSQGSKEYLSFGGGRQCELRMGTSWWKNHHLKRLDNKLPSRQVFDETVRGFGNFLHNKPLSQVRFLPAEFEQFQETVIVADYVAITIFTDIAYSLLIHDRLVAEGYRKHFELLWKQSKS
jgi:sugar-specific transcriptional regulator TrmB